MICQRNIQIIIEQIKKKLYYKLIYLQRQTKIKFNCDSDLDLQDNEMKHLGNERKK